MHKTRLPSVTLHHDSDFSGLFVLANGEGGVIASRDMLEVAVRGVAEHWVRLTGPDSACHRRGEVAAASLSHTVAPGNWTQRTLRVARRDLENVLVLARTAQLVTLAERIAMGTRPYREMAEQLDAAAAALEPLAAGSLPRLP